MWMNTVVIGFGVKIDVKMNTETLTSLAKALDGDKGEGGTLCFVDILNDNVVLFLVRRRSRMFSEARSELQ